MSVDDPRVFEVVQEYLAAVEAGHRPDRNALLDRYPELRGAVAACLDGLEMVREAAPELHDRSGSLADHKPLGDFQLVREVGRGGMGVVYEAVQLSLNRRVAVKVLPTAAALDDRQLQRFKNEARAAAQLHHPNIVPVYGVGCDRGVHYYAMQFIEGQSLAEVVRAMRAELAPASGKDGSERPSRGTALWLGSSVTGDGPPGGTDPGDRKPVSVLPMPAAGGETSGPAALATMRTRGETRFFQSAARLAEQAARALHYAHERGVVHRDVKPANLLLDARGILWVADFGLAQVQADAALTRTGDLPGTLRYMSPEQARGDRSALDPRTDVYSLGATLYELLTLQPAHDAADRAELLRGIAEGEPPSPRQVTPAVPVDLDVVVRKALARDPVDRYATADDFADDLRRFARGEPIRAKLPGLGQRVARWAVRHRGAVAAAAAVLLLLTAGLAASTVLVGRERDRARERAAEAERHFRQARGAVDYFTRVCMEDLADVPPSHRDVRRRMLTAALDYYKEFLHDEADDPALKAELEQAQERTANLLTRLLAHEQGAQAVTAAALARTEAVRTELHVTEEQGRQLDELLPKMPAGKPGGPFRWELPSGRKINVDLAAILTPEQNVRLKQITLQVRGLEAMLDHDVAAELRLTEEQARVVRQAARPGPQSFVMAGAYGIVMRRAGLPAQVLEVLTPDQKATWAKLVGSPFTANVAPLFGPPPFGKGASKRFP